LPGGLKRKTWRLTKRFWQGTASGLFFGLAFGLVGIGTADLDYLANLWGIATI